MKLWINVSWEQLRSEIAPQTGDFYWENGELRVFNRATSAFQRQDTMMRNHTNHGHTIVEPIREVLKPKMVYSITAEEYKHESCKIGDSNKISGRLTDYRCCHPFPDNVLIPAILDLSGSPKSGKIYAEEIGNIFPYSYQRKTSGPKHEWRLCSISEVIDRFQNYYKERTSNEACL